MDSAVAAPASETAAAGDGSPSSPALSEKRKRGDLAAVGGDETPSSPSREEKRMREAPEMEPKPKRGTHPMWKTSLCSFFRRRGNGADGCNHGDGCRYAHSEAELRPRPDGTWDPTSLKGKGEKAEAMAAEQREEVEAVTINGDSLDKCVIGLPRSWDSDKVKAFFDEQGIKYKTVRKKKGMPLGFMSFEDVEQLQKSIEIFAGTLCNGKEVKVSDAIRRSDELKRKAPPVSDEGLGTDNTTEDSSVVDSIVSKKRNVRDAVTPLAHMPYSDQLEHKKNSLVQILKKLTRNAKKACPDAVPHPEWIVNSRAIGGLPCKFEGIIESPIINGYRNKCEFSIGYSLDGKRTVGYMLGNFREGITAVEEPIDCLNVSKIACQYASIFQSFLQSSDLPVWGRTNNTGFWRQFTVREGRQKPDETTTQDQRAQISEVMLIVQVCSTGVDEELMNNEFGKMSTALSSGAAACSPPLPLTSIVVQDHKGISNAAPANCPLIPLLVRQADSHSHSEKMCVDDTRIHDYIDTLCFSISPTAFFQVNTLAAEKLYTLAGDWADLNKDTLLFDVCCGTGTIGLTLASRVGMVVGIEMNESAVSDAVRNAAINQVQNCRFVCGKAEDVIGSLLAEYLGVAKQDSPVPKNISNGRDDCEGNEKNVVKIDKSNGNQPADSCASVELCIGEDLINSVEKKVENDLEARHETMQVDEVQSLVEEDVSCVADAENRACTLENGTPMSRETVKVTGSSECAEACQNDPLPKVLGSNPAVGYQFKNVVAIVDPPRAGLHPIVIKVLRTDPRIRRLVYISCNPDSLVANAIELCTPTVENPEKNKGNKGWRNMSAAGLARHRTKSMPYSEPFCPVKAMAVDLFPHTAHCEMVMLFER